MVKRKHAIYEEGQWGWNTKREEGHDIRKGQKEGDESCWAFGAALREFFSLFQEQ